MSRKFVGESKRSEKSSRPDAGSTLSCTAKMYCSVRPRTKTGMLIPSSETIVTAPSDQLWAWRAAKRPRGMPTPTA